MYQKTLMLYVRLHIIQAVAAKLITRRDVA
jgi:hypothetical protein